MGKMKIRLSALTLGKLHLEYRGGKGLRVEGTAIFSSSRNALICVGRLSAENSKKHQRRNISVDLLINT